MKNGPFTIDDRGMKRGPFSEVDICRLVQEGVLQSGQLITTTSGEEITAGELSVERVAPQEVPPTPTLPSKKPSWDPCTIGWLGLVFSPFWSGIMAAVNARRLGMEQPAWRPIVINLVAVAIGVVLDLVGLRVHLVTAGLFVGATWLIWRLDLRPQVDAYRAQTAVHPSGGGWLVPLIAGSPLAITVFVLFVVAPLFPETPAYVTANEAGLVFYNEGEYKKSLTFFDRAVQLNPDYVDAINNRGQANYSLGQFDAALVDFNNAIRLAPDEMLAYNNRGLTLTEMEQYDKAIHDFNNAIRLVPGEMVVYLNRGTTLTEMEQYDRAIRDFNKVIEELPNNDAALQGRGVAYLGKGDTDSAIADFNKALLLDPLSPGSLLYRGVAYSAQGNGDKAMADFTQSIHLDPKNPFAYNMRGVVYFDKNEYAHAIADFSEALRLAPDFQQARENKHAAEQAKSQGATNKPNAPDQTAGTFKPWRPLSHSAMQENQRRIPPAGYVAGGRGIYYLLVHGGLGKKLFIVLVAVWAGLVAFWNRLSAN